MKISQLSKLTGVSARSIRHYEKKRLIRPKRLDNDYREFDEDAIERVKAIQIYLGMGLTTDEIAEVLDCNDDYSEVYEYCEEMMDFYEDKLDEINGRILRLAAVKLRLEEKIGEMNRMKDDVPQVAESRMSEAGYGVYN
ncbi:MerR family transcriptional regulator [Paenibacillus ihbetae]|uniref:MerR family transcriptional regulator n=1 Tax=Paenibacillus ihbetae TaxID=1870820 RepID=A0A1B2DV57_9BACL|nr:MerR family transcriptional regulator [Paenibacillus ihbetae]ANY71571.1 MerR family transcriptional regulator [Paenibacillus ihbetae]